MGSSRHVVSAAIVIALSTVLFAADAPPEAAEQATIVAAMREAALAYDRNLPNFICSQTTRREVRREPDLTLGVRTGGGRQSSATPIQSTRRGQWEAVDDYEQQLSYFDHRETYLLVRRNGKSVKKGDATAPGLASSGEFGSTLNHIFEAESKTDFEWKRADVLRGHPVYVFEFRILKENSAAQMSAGSETIIVAYHGLLFADRDTKTIMRVTTEAEVPPAFPLQNVTHVLDYGQFTIAGEQFLLPLRAEVQSRASEEFMQSGRTGGSSKLATLRNSVDFSGYRKYTSESTLKPE
jgi:hypothetical protein